MKLSLLVFARRLGEDMEGPKTPRDDAPDGSSRGLRAPEKGESSSSGVPLNAVPQSPVPFDPDATMVDLDATLIDVVRMPSAGSPAPSGLFSSAAILQPGDVLGGRYEILQLLGE